MMAQSRAESTGDTYNNGQYINQFPPNTWASHLHRIQPALSQDYTLISSTRRTCSLIDGWVNMLHINRCKLLKAKSFFIYIYIKYMISKYIL